MWREMFAGFILVKCKVTRHSPRRSDITVLRHRFASRIPSRRHPLNDLPQTFVRRPALATLAAYTGYRSACLMHLRQCRSVANHALQQMLAARAKRYGMLHLYQGVHCQSRTPRFRVPMRSMSSSWVNWLNGQSRHSDPSNQISDGQDEAARAAILEKVMKGRQPTDLMLRCKYSMTRQNSSKKAHD